jgi:uncharacterized membrane protein YidH (DUF202 family)
MNYHDITEVKALIVYAVLLMICGIILLVGAIIHYARRDRNFIANDELTSERITVDLRREP